MADRFMDELPVLPTVDTLVGNLTTGGVTQTGQVPRSQITGGGSPADIAAVAVRATALEADLAPGARAMRGGANIASASAIDLGGATGDFTAITGTTTITSLGTAPAGIERTVYFTSILTLTHNGATLVLPGGANIVTAAGDAAKFRSHGGGSWRCVSFLRATGKRLLNDPASYADAQAGLRNDVDMTPANTKSVFDARIGSFQAEDAIVYYQGRAVARAVKDSDGRVGLVLTDDGYLFAKFAIKLGANANGLTINQAADGFLAIGLGSEAGKLPIGSNGDLFDASVAGSFGGFLRAIVDSAGRMALGVRDDGTIVIPKLEAGSGGGSGGSSTAESADYWFEAKTVAGKSQIIRTAKATGIATPITSLGANSAPRLSADGANVIYATDRFGASVAMFQPVGGGAEHRVLPMKSVCCWGDSLTAGSGISVAGKDYPSQLVALAGRETYRASGSGQKSDQIAARAGAVPITLTVTGGVIPTSGSVACTGVAPDFMNTSGGAMTLPVVIAGVPGTMVWTTAGGYVFTPSIYPVTPVAAPPGTFCTPDLQGRDEWIWVPWMGRNNWYQPDTVKANIAATIAQIKTMVKRFIVLGVVNAGSEPIGSSGHTNITAINAYLAATYPDNFIDIRRYLIDHGLTDAGITPTSQDLADIANDVIPTSLRADDVHGKDAYYLIVAQRVAAFIAAKGW